ncbi:hypothetical protein HPB50_014461 [Hyalomma asiaticum]|uniref:Uncharacterized protein n=1 Tax=Hyalomma asiaticum TaxID=266040 RepID=A0ACB7T0Y6_HYAAI|nr:hypothetical protein HPB50_014461 [Hyalomma asiaticum]
MNQDREEPTYGTTPKDQSSLKQEAADSNLGNQDDSRTGLIAARPVASGGFSTSSVSEEFFKELKHIGKSFEQSGAQTKMLEDDLNDNGGDKAAEVAPSSGDKGTKEESNRLLKFQITAPQAPAAENRCTAGHGRCGCRRKECRNKRAAGKRHLDGHCSSKSRSSSRHPRRHRSASSAVDRRERRGEACSEVHKHPEGAPVTHRRQRHHHYRHQRRMRDGDFSGNGAQSPPTSPRRHRHCCRSSGASDCCCFRPSTKRASGGDHHRTERKYDRDEAENGTQHSCSKRSGRKDHTIEDNGSRKRADGRCEDVFSRYRTSYRSAETNSSTSSSSSSEDERGEQVAVTSRKCEGDGLRTLTFTQTRESSTHLHHRREGRGSGGRDRSRSGSRRRCVDVPVESTVEKHVLELNFPPSPLMRSISNLLELHCPCEDNVENKEAENKDEDDEEEKVDVNAERFVHRMKPGQTCELQGDSQVILVSLPEPHKLTVEHVIRSSSCLAEPERCKSRHLDGPKRGRAERQCDREIRNRDKNEDHCGGTVAEAPRIRRKHSYVRHTRRLKGNKSCQVDSAPPMTALPYSSSSSDSSEEDNVNDVKYSTEKGTEEVVVRPTIVKNSRRNRDRDELAGNGSSRQRELRLTIPKVKAGGHDRNISRKRSSGQRKTKRSSKARGRPPCTAS